MTQQTTPFLKATIATVLLAVTMSAHAAPPLDEVPPRGGPYDLPIRGPKGNVIFIHPDGAGANHWAAARMYWNGPDAVSDLGELPNMASYRGRMTDRLAGTSNDGATLHAFGYKVLCPGSFGKDGGGEIARDDIFNWPPWLCGHVRMPAVL